MASTDFNNPEPEREPRRPRYRFEGDCPAALEPWRNQRRWVACTADKVPIDPHTGRAAKISDPTTWGHFAEAQAAVRKYGLAGVWIALVEDDNLIGFDIDNCVSDAGSLSDHAAKVVEYAETYWEYSPSGNGLRGFALGEFKGGSKDDDLGIEAYGSRRFLSVSGNHVPDTPEKVREAPVSTEYLTTQVEKARDAKRQRNGGNGAAQLGGSEFFRNLKAEALARLDDWVTKVLPAAEKQATGGWRVKSRNLNRDLEEDLSLHPAGITDWGTRRGLTAVDVMIEHGGAADATSAALRLCELMHVDPATLGWKGNRSAPKQEAEKPSLRLIAAWELEDEPELEPAIEGWQHKRTLATMIGREGKGKTLVALHKGTHLAADLPWCGRKVEQGVVIYIVGEAADSIKMRLLGLWKHMGLDPRNVPFYIIEDPLDFVHSRRDLDRVIALIKSFGFDRISLIEIDTASSVLAGEKEDDRGFGALAMHMQVLKNEFGCIVEALHHQGKDEERGSRGSTVLPCKVDTEVTVTQPTDDRIEIKATKQRDLPKESIFFRIKTQTFKTKRGTEVTVPIAVWDEEGKAAKSTRPKLNDKQQIAYAALCEAILDHGNPAPESGTYPPGVHVVSHHLWRDLAFAKEIYEPNDPAFTSKERRKWQDKRRQTFNRASAGLRDKGLMAMYEGLVWIPHNQGVL